ncbi:hypothetical protein OHB49_11770 [Streptomyces sp. NBC_01717]|uniref:hypothetical protein n=1 Tax=unclassified Streptomyces TaxID=2593676 RepID=UPI002E2ECAAB|nr:hypothetical protein [Streptomyces sp. NBC_01717]
MPVILVNAESLSDGERASLAAVLTTTAVGLAEVQPEKVQVFFAETPDGPNTVHVLAIKHGPGADTWEAAFRHATGRRLEVRVHLYPADRTAKGGVLRTP